MSDYEKGVAGHQQPTTPTPEERNKSTAFSAGDQIKKTVAQDAERLRNEATLPREIISNSYAALLAESAVDPSEEISNPPICITIDDGNNTSVLGTMGNISVAIGKAKSRKTFAVGVIVAAALTGKLVLGRIRGHLPEGRKLILYFDTEQSRYHLQRSIKRICALVGLDNPANLKAYGLRSVPTEKRRDAIEWAIYNTPDVGFVVIDGIRDLVFDINSPEEATDTATRLLRWTDERQIHILTVLHQNKGDQNARGHLGTELVNKAETVLSVTKDPENKAVSVVSAEQCRDVDFEPFGFSIDENGLPYLVDAPDNANTSRGKKDNSKKDVTPDEVASLFDRAFSNSEFLGYGQLRTNLLEGSEFNGQTLSKNDAEILISRAVNSKVLDKKKPGGKGHEKYFLNPNNNHPERLS